MNSHCSWNTIIRVIKKINRRCEVDNLVKGIISDRSQLGNGDLHMGVSATVVAAVDSAERQAREVSILGFRAPTAEHVCDGKH